MVKFVKNKEGVELKRGNIPQYNTHIPQHFGKYQNSWNNINNYKTTFYTNAMKITNVLARI